MNKTIAYYNKHAKEFYDRTIYTDLTNNYKKFLKYLPEKSHILDAGCGVGRDAKYFSDQGYIVTAFDASEAMVKLATQETKLPVLLSTFSEMNFQQAFDGVWAQASLLHIPYKETKNVYRKIHQALKPGGVFYGSYKQGQDYMPTEERDFWNMNKESIKPYFEDLFEVIEIWEEVDTRSKLAPSRTGLWLNFIVKKQVV